MPDPEIIRDDPNPLPQPDAIEAETPSDELQGEEPSDDEALLRESLEEPEGDGEEEGDDPDDNEEPLPEDDEFEDVEWNGKTIKAPKGLKESLMMQADYTRKTQEVAEKRRELDGYAQQLTEQARTSEEDLTLRAKYMTNAEQLNEYRQINWDAWTQQDPIEAQQAFIRFQNLERQTAEVGNQLQQRAQQRTVEAQQDLAKRINETREFAKTSIPNYTPEIEQRVIDFAVQNGVEIRDLQAAMNPTVFKILHMARLGAEVMNKPATKPKTQAAPIQPLTKVGNRGGNPLSSKDPGEMSMDEYVKWRQRGGG